MLCPKCHKPLDLNRLHCESGHYFSSENGVIVLMDNELRQHVKTIYKHRDENVNLPMITDYDMLPCSLAGQHFEWRMRCHDLTIVKKQLASKAYDRILEVGAWNGWLTHHVARMAKSVTAIDYSAHPTDGLGAKQNYSASWRAIQMDVTDLSVLEDQNFDVIVMNHGLHLFPDPVAYIQSLKRLLKPNGKLICISLTFFRDPSYRIGQVNALQTRFENQHSVPFFFKPSRGYMDYEDKAKLESLGIHIKRYPQLWKANLKSWQQKSAPAYFYGVYENHPL